MDEGLSVGTDGSAGLAVGLVELGERRSEVEALRAELDEGAAGGWRGTQGARPAMRQAGNEAVRQETRQADDNAGMQVTRQSGSQSRTP